MANEEMKKVVLSKDMFDIIKDLCSPYIKDYCDFCKCIVNRDNFGILTKDYTCCNNIICLFEYMEKEEEELKQRGEEL